MLTKEYELVKARNSKQLKKLVEAKLAENWDLWGNPLVVNHKGSIVLIQAMVRINDDGVGVISTVGYAVQVPETPTTVSGISVSTQRALETLSTAQLTGGIVQNVRSLFAGILCSCAKVEGDDPYCPIHRKPISGITL